MNIQLWIILLLLLFRIVPDATSQNSAQTLTSRDFKCSGLTIDNDLIESVFALTTTADGFIWMGTFDGVIRFDGLNSTLFNRQNVKAMKEDDCRSLFAGSGDSLYLGMFNGLCLVYKNGIFSPIGDKTTFFNRSITRICQDSPGTVYIVPDGKGLVSFAGNRFTYYSTSTGLPSDNVISICKGRANELWIATDKGLCKLQNQRIVKAGRESGNFPVITAMFCDSDGILWIGDAEGSLWKFDNSVLTKVTIPGYQNRYPVQALHKQDHEAAIWIGTKGNGIFRVDPANNSYLSLNSKDGMAAGIILNITGDGTGNILAGTQGDGLVRITRNKVRTYTTNDGLRDNSVMGMYADRSGRIFIGHENGKVSFYEAGKFGNFPTLEGNQGEPVFSLASSASGRLFAGTVGPLIAFDGNSMTRDLCCQSLGNSLVHALFQSSTGDLWVGTDAGVYIISKDNVQTLTTKDGLSDDRIFCFMEDHKGRIWIGTQEGGITIWEHGKLSRITTADGLSDNLVLSLFEDRHHNIWIGTGHSGLNRYDPVAGKISLKKAILPQHMITHISDDRSGRIWAGTEAGIFAFNSADIDLWFQNRSDHVAMVRLGVEDGMLNNSCTGGVFPGGIKTHDGKLWFATPDGIVEVNPSEITIKPGKSSIVITQLLCNDDTIYQTGIVKLPAGVIHLDIEYTAPGLNAPDDMKFRYKLEGYDSEWETGHRDRRAHYTKVPPGNYRFVAEVTDEFGQWTGNQVAVNIEVAPFYYQTWWFILICIVTGILLLYFSATYRLKQIREKELEVLVRKRTDEISRLNESLEQQVIDRTSQLSAANAELETFTYSVSHDLRAPARRIGGLIDVIMEDYGGKLDDNGRDLLLKISESTKNIGELIEEFLKLSRIARQEITRMDIDLSALAEEISVKLHQQHPGRKVQWLIERGILLNADANLVRIVLQNILDNAWKYTQNVEEAIIEVGLTEKEGKKMIFIRDNGAGFDMNHYNKLFIPFQRLHSENEFSGTGIGLATVKRIVLKHGGAIFAEGTPGLGATFYFTFA